MKLRIETQKGFMSQNDNNTVEEENVYTMVAAGSLYKMMVPVLP